MEDVLEEVEADTEFGALIPGQLLLWRCHSGPMLVRAEGIRQLEYVEGHAMDFNE